ncbi:MAG: DUF1801 domain-containing protein [Verrucomicrobiae bacterium]|nr:DUF1801 domain-containing protein [Verrucomicrobiae bacterium]
MACFETMNQEFDNSDAVNALIERGAHPLTLLIQEVRRTILSVNPTITEGVKWNSPSFYRHGWFATIRAFRPDKIEVIFHHGAKRKDDSPAKTSIQAPSGFLRWPSPDRAIATLTKDDATEAFLPILAKVAADWAKIQIQTESP